MTRSISALCGLCFNATACLASVVAEQTMAAAIGGIVLGGVAAVPVINRLAAVFTGEQLPDAAESADDIALPDGLEQ